LQPLDPERVREWRHRRMLSQQEVADRAGTSLFTIQRIERGEGNVRPKTGRAVAEALGVGVEDLLPKAQAPLPFEEPETRAGERRVPLSAEDKLERLRALSAGIKTSTALAAKSVQTGLWLGGTTTEDLQSLNALEAEWGVSSEELLDALMAEKPELADVLDRMARRALENKATHRAEVSNAIEHTGA
jgi:transcriptional regulator with XRE-family HTH domain